MKKFIWLYVLGIILTLADSQALSGLGNIK